MANRSSSPTPSLRASPGTRLFAILLCLALLFYAHPVPGARAATITVTNLNDSGAGSLRQAIATAVPGDTIDFSVTGTITLTSGQLTIDKNLTITGPGESNLTISGNNSSRVFQIASGPYDVIISGLTIADGYIFGVGGGIVNSSTGAVLLENVTFNANDAHEGSGLYNDLSNPTLHSVTFTNNTAIDYGAGMYNAYSNPTLENVSFNNNAADWGGGMANWSSSPTLTNVNFSGNYAEFEGGGMHNHDSSPTLTNVTFNNNTTDLNGGGMYNRANSHPTLTNVAFDTNSAVSYGGGMYNDLSSPTLATDVSFNSNFAEHGGGMYNHSGSNPTLTDVDFISNYTTGGYDGRGGGMYNYNSSPTLIDVTFLSNKSEFGAGGGMYNVGSNPTLTDVTFYSNYSGENNGGGMFNSGSSPSLTEVTFRNNWANGNGGGMYNTSNSNPTLTGVTFSSNWAEFNGGGMYNIGSSPSLTDVTFSNNDAYFTDGGGMYNGDSGPTLTNVTLSGNSAQFGGGIWNSVNSDPILLHVTISGNSALSGGGLYSESVTTPTLSNTILAGNSAVSGPDCYGTIISGNYNLIGDPFFCDFSPQANDQIGIDPLLGPLADNGGETQTRALLISSPAIDAIPFGDNGCGTAVTSDQRGEARPVPTGGNCDIGAFEYVPPPLPETGFPTRMVTALPAQPAEKAYTALGELWLELPDLGVQAPIVSVPFAGGGWDVSWLGSSAGYLPGSAFPTWPGNTVLTGHVWDAHNRPGIFVDLKQLRYNDRIAIHAWGATYLYAVRESRLISPQAVDIVMQHKELDWVTLLTCEDYRFDSEGYIFRRMVRAVLVEVVPDR